jgi:hypothetical protein
VRAARARPRIAIATRASSRAKPACPLDPGRAEQPVGGDADRAAAGAEHDPAAGGAAVREEPDRALAGAGDQLGRALEAQLQGLGQGLPGLARRPEPARLELQLEGRRRPAFEGREARAAQGGGEVMGGRLGGGARMVQAPPRQDQGRDQGEQGDHDQQLEQPEAAFYQLTTSRSSPSPPSAPSAPRLARS